MLAQLILVILVACTHLLNMCLLVLIVGWVNEYYKIETVEKTGLK